jgi:phosphoribosylformylglycinamidine synthase
VHQAIGEGLLSACHDLSDGGLAVAAAEMALGGRLGASIDLSSVRSTEELSAVEALYSESASRFMVSVPEDKAERFEALFGQDASLLGRVNDSAELTVTRAGKTLFACTVSSLVSAFKGTLNW